MKKKPQIPFLLTAVLQAKLTRLALYIGYIGMGAAGLTFICLVIRFCISEYVVKGQKGKASDVSYFISFLIQSITVVVVSVPEGKLLSLHQDFVYFSTIGLPLAVTLALAYAVRVRFSKENQILLLFD